MHQEASEHENGIAYGQFEELLDVLFTWIPSLLDRTSCVVDRTTYLFLITSKEIMVHWQEKSNLLLLNCYVI
jgi:hypothetical protein